MERITCLFYSNENYLPIVDLSINEFNKFSKDIEIQKILVSNKFPKKDKFKYKKFKKIDAGVELRQDTRHFASVLLKGLEQVKTKYVLFLLDDTLIINNIKKESLNGVLNFMDGENVDHISLISYGHDWDVFNADYQGYGLPNDYIFHMNMSYIYMFSLQPSIWKTSSLVEILKYNLDISISEFDTTQIKNKKGQKRGWYNSDGYTETPTDFWDYGFKHCCFKRYFENTPFLFDDRPEEGDYFLFMWNESIGGGKFNVNRHLNAKEHMLKFLNKKNITKEHKIYGKFMV